MVLVFCVCLGKIIVYFISHVFKEQGQVAEVHKHWIITWKLKLWKYKCSFRHIGLSRYMKIRYIEINTLELDVFRDGLLWCRPSRLVLLGLEWCLWAWFDSFRFKSYFRPSPLVNYIHFGILESNNMLRDWKGRIIFSRKKNRWFWLLLILFYLFSVCIGKLGWPD